MTRRSPLSGANAVSPPSSTSAKHITLHDDGASDGADKALEKKFGNRQMPPAGMSDRWAEGWSRRHGGPIPDVRSGDHGGRDILVDPLPDPDHAVAQAKKPRASRRRLTPKAAPTEQLLVVMTRGRPVKTRCALTREQYDAFMATLELDAAEREQEAAVRRTVEAVRRDESARLALKAADRAQRLRAIQSYGVKATEVTS